MFNSDILGLEYLKPIDAEIRAKGHVSDLYADEDGPVYSPIQDNLSEEE